MELAELHYLVLHSLKAGFHLSLIDNCVEVGGVANQLLSTMQIKALTKCRSNAV